MQQCILIERENTETIKKDIGGINWNHKKDSGGNHKKDNGGIKIPILDLYPNNIRN